MLYLNISFGKSQNSLHTGPSQSRKWSLEPHGAPVPQKNSGQRLMSPAKPKVPKISPSKPQVSPGNMAFPLVLTSKIHLQVSLFKAWFIARNG